MSSYSIVNKYNQLPKTSADYENEVDVLYNRYDKQDFSAVVDNQSKFIKHKRLEFLDYRAECSHTIIKAKLIQSSWTRRDLSQSYEHLC